jgi:transcription elongation factor Elf1
MYEEIYRQPPNQGWGRRKSRPTGYTRRQPNTMEKGFRCEYCGAYVYTLPMIAGVNNRNHCPFCLWSRHVDYLKPGDRMSACRAAMQPIGLTVKQTHDKYTRVKTGRAHVNPSLQ